MPFVLMDEPQEKDWLTQLVPDNTSAPVPAKKKKFVLLDEKAAPIPANDGNLIGDIIGNATAGVNAAGDLVTGRWFSGSHDKSNALAEKLMEGFSDDPTIMNVLKYAFTNRGKAAPGEVSGALLEQMGNNPFGKAATAIGGVMPHYNAASAIVGRYGVKPLAEVTGIPEENINLALLTSVPSAKIASKAPMIRNTKVGAALAKPYDKAASTPDPLLQFGRNRISDTRQFSKDVKEGLNAPDSEGLNLRAEAMERKASNLATAMRKAQVTLTKSESQRFLARIENEFKKPENALNPELHAGTMKQLQNLRDLAAKGELRLADINDIRSLLGDTKGQDSAMAGVMRGAMERGLSKIDKSGIKSGDPTGIQNYKEFLNVWKQKSRYEEGANLIKGTDTAASKADALRNKFTNFTNNPDKTKFFSPEEVELAKKVRSETTSDLAQKTAGIFGLGQHRSSFYPLLGANALAVMSGYGIPSVAITAASTLARGARDAAVRGRAERFLQAVASRDTSAAPIAEGAPPTPLMLPAPKTNFADVLANKQANVDNANRMAATEPDFRGDWQGNMKQGIPETMPAYAARRQEYQNLGLGEVAKMQGNKLTQSRKNAMSQSAFGSEDVNPDIPLNIFENIDPDTATGIAGQFVKGILAANNKPLPPTTLTDYHYRLADQIKQADMENAPLNSFINPKYYLEALKAEIDKPDISAESPVPFSAEVRAINAKEKAGGLEGLGEVGRALLEALSSSQKPKKKPLKINISKDKNIGADGLPKVDLPEGR